MGLLGAVIVAVVGIILTLLFNWLPITTFLKIVPICWIPGFQCSKWYNEIKTYLIIIILSIIVFFIPIV